MNLKIVDFLNLDILKHLLYCVFTTCFSVIANAQEPVVSIQYFSVEDGLSDRTVKSIGQDERGMVWVGTKNGLNRFDGKNFKEIDTKKDLLKAGEFIGIKKSNDGNLWLQKSREPVILFDPIKEALLRIPFVKNDSIVDLFLIDTDRPTRQIYFHDHGGKIYFLNDSSKVEPFGTLQVKNGTRIKTTDNQNLLIIPPHSDSTYEIDRFGKVLQSFRSSYHKQQFFPELHTFSFTLTFSQFNRNKHREFKEYFIFLDGNSHPYNFPFYKAGQPLKLSDLHNYGVIKYAFSQDHEGNSWLIANHKVLLFDKNHELKLDLTEEIIEITGIEWKMDCIFVDDQNRLWIGNGLGLFLIHVTGSPFQKFLNDEDHFSIRGITSIEENHLLVGSYKGTKVIDLNSGKVKNLVGKHFMTMTHGANGSIFAGAHGHLIFSIDKNLQVRNHDFSSILNEGAETPFYSEPSNILYIGTLQGLFFSKDNCLTVEAYSKLNGFDDLMQQTITSFRIVDNQLWVGSSNGLYQLDEDQGVLAKYDFPYPYIKHVHADKDGNFWLATEGGGLIFWNRKSGKKVQFTTENGLSNNVIYAVYEDKNGFLWLPSNRGLMRFNKNTYEVTTFQPEDGIAHEEFNTHAHFQAKDGRLFFGGLNGITAFYPDQVIPPKNEAPLIVTQLQQFDYEAGKLVNKTNDYLENQTIVLRPGDKFFNLKFSLLDYAKRDHTYAWKIVGYDDEWTYQNNNDLRINALPYGDYYLKIKAQGTGGIWAEQQLNIPIQVIKPFYLQWPFILTITGGMATIIFGIIKWRINWLEREKKKLEKIVAERTYELAAKNKELEAINQTKDRFFAIIAHDLRSPLIALRGLAKKAIFLMKKNRMDDLEILGDDVDKAVGSVHKLLDNLLSWALVKESKFPYNPQILHTHEIIQKSLSIYQEIAANKKINISVDVPEDHLIFADLPGISTVIRNLIDNAIKFTDQNGNIAISAYYSEGCACVAVKDSGVGIPRENIPQIFEHKSNRKTRGTFGENGAGLGLTLCRELVEMNQGTIYAESILGEGTTFIVKFPKSKTIEEKAIINKEVASSF